MDKPYYSLHLFAGAGGGIIAEQFSQIVPVCAVEIDVNAQRMLRNRFPELAIWDDVTTFRSDNPECFGAIAELRSVADSLVVAGGFPCQDISSAGKGAGIRGEKSGLWFEFARIVREIRPGWVFVENSDQLVSRGLGDVLGSLAEMGYDAAWGVLGAADMGAWHRRNRIWITARLADAESQ